MNSPVLYQHVPMGMIWASKLELESRGGHSRLPQVIGIMRVVLESIARSIASRIPIYSIVMVRCYKERQALQMQSRAAYPKKRARESKT